MYTNRNLVTPFLDLICTPVTLAQLDGFNGSAIPLSFANSKKKFSLFFWSLQYPLGNVVEVVVDLRAFKGKAPPT